MKIHFGDVSYRWGNYLMVTNVSESVKVFS